MSNRVLPALFLILAAGASTSAKAQPAAAPSVPSSTVAPTRDFRTSQWFSDRVVVNSTEEVIASVSDLIVDRGSGRIQYIVVVADSIHGLGGRTIAIPFAAFRWEKGERDRLLLGSTLEQLRQFPEYSPEAWKVLKKVSDGRSSLHQKLDAGAANASDPYASSLDTANRARIEGTITSIERINGEASDEQIEIHVTTADGSIKRIALGPSWYVNISAASPMRGDNVTVETLALPHNPDQLLVATEYRNSDRELKLRGSDGTPAWALGAIKAGRKNYSVPYSRYLLLSDLRGSKIHCRGYECGKVHEIIIDRHSGAIGSLSFDPNRNFLGVGDTMRLVPWSVAAVKLDGAVRLDASKDMVLSSPETPSATSTLNTVAESERVYRAFDIKAPRHSSLTPVAEPVARDTDAWSRGGSILNAIERDTPTTFEGTVVEVREVAFDHGVSAACAFRIRTSGNSSSDEVVLIGPASLIVHQKLECKPGDQITVEAYRTTIDGRPCWIARSFRSNATRVVLLDDNYAPAWTQP